MFNKFKIGQFVLVTGIGKCEDKKYYNQKAKVIEKDDYFLDYKVEFSNGTTDWLDEKYLRKPRKYNKT